MATAQYLSDLAVALAERGHDVTVICSRRAYDSPERCFPKCETWRGIKIRRIPTTAFGKQARWRRAADFASFIFCCGLRLLFTPRVDVVVALTSPPLISFLGAGFAWLHRARFVYWVMDLNPDEAIAAGWLREGSLAARFLHTLSRFSFRRAQKIIALDRFMRQRIEAKGIAPEKIAVIPPWSHGEAVRFDPASREQFRAGHGLTDKFVVMYSGNHSPCHPLATLLAAAGKLSPDPRFVFLFVGGGSEFRRIETMVKIQNEPRTSNGPSEPTTGITHYASRITPDVSNLLCLPYQPLDQLSASLSAADLHVVVMGEPFVGVIHPCKIYNILGVGAPVLYLGPAPSHLSEILGELASRVCTTVAHGEVDRCAEEILRLAATRARGESGRYAAVARKFGQPTLLTRLVAELEKLNGRPKQPAETSQPEERSKPDHKW